jgi:hypothetical protein
MSVPKMPKMNEPVMWKCHHMALTAGKAACHGKVAWTAEAVHAADAMCRTKAMHATVPKTTHARMSKAAHRAGEQIHWRD